MKRLDIIANVILPYYGNRTMAKMILNSLSKKSQQLLTNFPTIVNKCGSEFTDTEKYFYDRQ
jgi:hypothetical protein